MTKRKGASKKADITEEILYQLNRGEIETATLTESLAIDFRCLMMSVFEDISEEQLGRLSAVKDKGIVERMKVAASVLLDVFKHQAFLKTYRHPCDTVRGWAAFVLALQENTSLEEKLEKIKPLADDEHFGVREWAWLALRNELAADVTRSIDLFKPWVASESANIRRFAIESVRPRGVWSKHIALLKETPELIVPLLDCTMEDESRYVQDSAANWLNDAAKTRPEWVVSYTGQWLHKSTTKATQYIAKRARRSIK